MQNLSSAMGKDGIEPPTFNYGAITDASTTELHPRRVYNFIITRFLQFVNRDLKILLLSGYNQPALLLWPRSR